jgi:hypothetical protein
MQTFLPFEDFKDCAKILDDARLGKQRVEVLQIYNTLTKGSRWNNHPAVTMWNGHLDWLLRYGIVICREWRSRGFKDFLVFEFLNELKRQPKTDKPWWLGRQQFHLSHQANLVRKSSTYYKFDVPPQTTYRWPGTGIG